jgi:hypothetical protein
MTAPEPSSPMNDDPEKLAIIKLVDGFANALRAKLMLAHANGRRGWQEKDWEHECQQGLLRHVAKGDPRDVAAFCAFMWHHNWITVPAAPATPAPDVSDDAIMAAIKQAGIGDVHYHLVNNGRPTEIAKDFARALTSASAARNSSEVVPAQAIEPEPDAGVAEIVRQHLRWIKSYAEMMTETNWRDMKLRLERQVEAMEPALQRTSAVTVDPFMEEYKRDTFNGMVERLHLLEARLAEADSKGDALRIILGNQLAMMCALHQLMRGFLAPDPLAQERLSARILATRALTDVVTDVRVGGT